jgi:hypothetical protein
MNYFSYRYISLSLYLHSYSSSFSDPPVEFDRTQHDRGCLGVSCDDGKQKHSPANPKLAAESSFYSTRLSRSHVIPWLLDSSRSVKKFHVALKKCIMVERGKYETRFLIKTMPRRSWIRFAFTECSFVLIKERNLSDISDVPSQRVTVEFVCIENPPKNRRPHNSTQTSEAIPKRFTRFRIRTFLRYPPWFHRPRRLSLFHLY